MELLGLKRLTHWICLFSGHRGHRHVVVPGAAFVASLGVEGRSRHLIRDVFPQRGGAAMMSIAPTKRSPDGIAGNMRTFVFVCFVLFAGFFITVHVKVHRVPAPHIVNGGTAMVIDRAVLVCPSKAREHRILDHHIGRMHEHRMAGVRLRRPIILIISLVHDHLVDISVSIRPGVIVRADLDTSGHIDDGRRDERFVLPIEVSVEGLDSVLVLKRLVEGHEHPIGGDFQISDIAFFGLAIAQRELSLAL